MWRRATLAVGLAATGLAAVVIGPGVTVWSAQPEPAKEDVPLAPKTAPSRVVGVTVYQNSALVTREVDVPAGTGTLELVVSPLPPQTVDSSLYSEGGDGLRVLTTRYRMRPIQEDTREEVRKAQAQLQQLQRDGQKLQSDIKVAETNLQLLAKLETFTGANLQHQTEKGTLNSDGVMALARYVMDSRTDKAQALVALQQQLHTNQEQIQYVQRQLRDLTAGTSKTERDAVIVVDKQQAAPGKVRLNYLVNAAAWRPQYKFRAGKDNHGPVRVEYLAAVVQQTGEDWSHVQLVLSTAQPMLNAAPPDLKMLEVAVAPRGGKGESVSGPQGQPAGLGGLPSDPGFLDRQAMDLRKKAQLELNANTKEVGQLLYNQAAALDQTNELLVVQQDDLKLGKRNWLRTGTEGPTVTYHLPSRLTVPSRNDEQVLEVARIDMAPEYCYKAVPVLTPHVYRLANLTNKSPYVLLPGEATMYLGSDFVGRANLPLVAIGEQFTAGFGVDPQLQVQRQLVDKSRSTHGENQVLRYEYRILVSSYKAEPVKVQLWDRLPHSDTEAVGVSLVKASPEVSTDPLYVRESKPSNLLRWDLQVEPGRNGEKALAVSYEFKLELGRQMAISNFVAR
jgi:hypothetical protein